MCAIAVIMGGYLLIRSYTYQAPEAPSLEVHQEDKQQSYTGVFVLNLNTAPADSLELLRYIGPALADRIIEYRQKHPFTTTEDIMKVPGIGLKTYEKIRPFLKVDSF